MSKISVIIPVYNVEKYLDKCLESVVNQTYKNLEIICINDGSTDKSLEILKRYEKIDSRIKIINKINGGLSSARNYGLDNATGEYCYFVDSDDWIELDAMQKLHSIMINNKTDCIVHCVNNIAETSNENNVVQNCQDWFNSYTKENGIYDIPLNISKEIASVTWNKLYKKSIIDKFHCRFPEGLINEDEAFIWNYMIHCKNYFFCNEYLYNYLRRSDSIMGKRDNSPKVLDILTIQKIIFETVKKYKNIDSYKSILTNNYIDEITQLWQRMPSKYRKQAFLMIKEYMLNTNNDEMIKKAYNNLKYRNLELFIEWIFSIKNKNKHKVIKILGVKIKFKRNKI